jgi:shikimate kinase
VHSGQEQHIIFIGLPGVGKTTIGEAVASRLGRVFLDFDFEIERRTGMSVAEIFLKRGEQEFRELEMALSGELAVVPQGMVLAPGGGWVANRRAYSLLRSRGRIVYLRAAPATVLERLGPGLASRPLLLGEDPLAALEGLYGSRRVFYEAADVAIDTDALTPQQVTDVVVDLVRRFEPAYRLGLGNPEVE